MSAATIAATIALVLTGPVFAGFDFIFSFIGNARYLLVANSGGEAIPGGPVRRHSQVTIGL
jgi:hypothetical protein